MFKKTVLAASLAVSLFAAQGTMITDEELGSMNFFKNKGVNIAGKTMVGDLTMVSILADTPQGKQKINVFVTPDKQYVIVGGGFNDKSGEQLSIPIDMSKHKDGAAYSYGSGKSELFVFTDPECPFCKRMDTEMLANIDLKKYKVYVYFFPLSFHKNAESMSMYVMSREKVEDKIKALHAVSSGSQDYLNASYTEAQRAKLKELLAKQMEIASNLGVSGTPTVFDEKGKAVNWMELAKKSEKAEIKK